MERAFCGLGYEELPNEAGKMLQSLDEVYGVLKTGDIIRYLKNPLDPDSEEITDVYEGSGN